MSSDSQSGSVSSLEDNASPGKAARSTSRRESREVVEGLVKRVVPEEIHNVDEMMLQFRGREDELIETLRTMEERDVAQKARLSSQIAAKQKAKKTSSEESDSEVTTGEEDPMEKAATENEDESESDSESGVPANRSAGVVSPGVKSKSLGTGEVDSPASRKVQPKKFEQKQNALEAAIESGDWDAVGEAAAFLTDSSVASSANTSEIDRLADGVSTDGSSAGEFSEIDRFADGVSTDGSSAAGSAQSSDMADVAEELEEMIEAGDWSGVVKRASEKGASKKSDDKK